MNIDNIANRIAGMVGTPTKYKTLKINGDQGILKIVTKRVCGGVTPSRITDAMIKDEKEDQEFIEAVMSKFDRADVTENPNTGDVENSMDLLSDGYMIETTGEFYFMDASDESNNAKIKAICSASGFKII